MDLEYLRSATRPEHEATEAGVPLMSDGLTSRQYVRVLQGMYRAVHAWDEWAAQHAPTALAILLTDRRRSSLLEADLAHFGADIPCTSALQELDWIDAQTSQDARSAAFLGAMYVVEGSTLGGQYIARHAEQALGLEAGQGNAYFRGYGDQTGAMWRSFKAVLAQVPEAQTELVVQSAKRMFAFFAARIADAPSQDSKIRDGNNGVGTD